MNKDVGSAVSVSLSKFSGLNGCLNKSHKLIPLSVFIDLGLTGARSFLHRPFVDSLGGVTIDSTSEYAIRSSVRQVI